jgi:hypothetical protein
MHILLANASSPLDRDGAVSWFIDGALILETHYRIGDLAF